MRDGKRPQSPFIPAATRHRKSCCFDSETNFRFRSLEVFTVSNPSPGHPADLTPVRGDPGCAMDGAPGSPPHGLCALENQEAKGFQDVFPECVGWFAASRRELAAPAEEPARMLSQAGVIAITAESLVLCRISPTICSLQNPTTFVLHLWTHSPADTWGLNVCAG